MQPLGLHAGMRPAKCQQTIPHLPLHLGQLLAELVLAEHLVKALCRSNIRPTCVTVTPDFPGLQATFAHQTCGSVLEGAGAVHEADELRTPYCLRHALPWTTNTLWGLAHQRT